MWSVFLFVFSPDMSKGLPVSKCNLGNVFLEKKSLVNVRICPYLVSYLCEVGISIIIVKNAQQFTYRGTQN